LRALYLTSVWLHILAATLWIGGMGFLVLVVVPWLKRGDRARAATLIRETGERFRTVGWGCFAVVLVTGTYNLWFRGVRLGDFARASFLASPFGISVVAKLAVFAVVIALSAVHDFSIGPSATREMSRDPDGPKALALRKRASIMGRANALLALLLLAIAVTIVRGWP